MICPIMTGRVSSDSCREVYFMTKSVHVTAGTATMLYLAVKCPGGFSVAGVNVLPAIAVVTAMVGSYIPDFDTKPMHYIQGKKGLAKKVAKVKTKAVNCITGGHRGLTHTLVFPAICVAIMWYISTFFGNMPHFASLCMSAVFGFTAGWVIHIFADLFNGKGCPILWPFVKSHFHIMDFPSEGVGQWIWCVLYLIVSFMLILGKEIV